MKLRSFVATRLVPTAVAVAVVVGLAGIATGPAGASHKKSHAPKKTSSANLGKELKTIEAKIKGEKKATYQAVFTFKGTGSTKLETITFAQEPPKSYFKTSTSALINTGTESLTCSSSATAGSTSSTSGTQTALTGTTTSATTTTTTAPATEVCYKEPASAGALGSLLDLFSPTTALTYFNTAAASIDAKIAGYSVKFSTQSFGGLASRCATLGINGASYKYCVAKIGLLTYSGSSKGYFELKSFSSHPASSDFSVPAGAKVETLP
jgi:hypothetical protein